MPLEIVSFEPKHLSAVRRFSELVWSRPADETFHRWRYLECPSRPPCWVALRNGECVALLGTFERRWRFRDRELPALETHDWFTLPELRSSGIGIRLLRRVMALGKPLVAWGGSDDTRTLLPRLGWKHVGEARVMVLPVDSDDLATESARRIGAWRPLARFAARAAVRTWFRPRARAVPSGGVAVDVDSVGPEVLDLYRGPGITALPDLKLLAWMGQWSGIGLLQPTYFMVGGALRGWSLGLVKRQDDGLRAYLLELQTTDPALLDWMIHESEHRLRRHDPARVTAFTSLPAVREALARARFLDVGSRPVLVWPGAPGAELPSGPLIVGGLVTDRPLIPYPSQWPPQSASM